MNLSHQSVRVLQYIAKSCSVNVADIARHIGCAHNTASEIVKRLSEKKLMDMSVQDRIIVVVALRNGVSLFPALLMGIAGWSAFTFVYQKIVA